MDFVQIADKRKSLLRFVQDVESRDLLEDFHQAAPLSVSFVHLSRIILLEIWQSPTDLIIEDLPLRVLAIDMHTCSFSPCVTLFPSNA